MEYLRTLLFEKERKEERDGGREEEDGGREEPKHHQQSPKRILGSPPNRSLDSTLSSATKGVTPSNPCDNQLTLGVQLGTDAGFIC